MLLAKRPKPQRVDVNLMLLIVVAFKLGQDWSPEQISQWLRRAYPGDASMRLSCESIYRPSKSLSAKPSRDAWSGRHIICGRDARCASRGPLRLVTGDA